jgi:SnoaL-like domain
MPAVGVGLGAFVQMGQAIWVSTVKKDLEPLQETTFDTGGKAHMDALTQDLNALLDREKIQDCIARLARGEDRRSAEAITACYWPDSVTDFGIYKGTFKEYLAWVVPGAPAVLVTQHFLGQSLIDLRGDAARVETHVFAYHRVNTGEEERDSVIGGRYLDEMQRRGLQWRIAQRTMLYDWVQDLGLSTDWSKGMFGMPFSGGHYSGRALRDFSETFFGKAPTK